MSHFSLRSVLLGAGALLLAGCGDGAPTVSDIEQGYINETSAALDKAAYAFGGKEKIPQMTRDMISLRYKVSSPKCEKAREDLGWNCIFDLTISTEGGNVLPGMPVRNVQARVFQGTGGWLVEPRE